PGAGSRGSPGTVVIPELDGPAPGSRLPLIRPARLGDVLALEALVTPWVASGDLLPRSRYDLCRHIREYHVAVDHEETVVGSVALKLYSLELGELGALAVRSDRQGAGLGRALCATVVEEARELGLHEVFALTRQPLFFSRLGFEPAEREHFPLKVWADCARCPRQDACDEVAVTLKL
ncbi:MAG TPA: GNAT family N-acetyltransferase, partial [Gemmatimonadales bacterium]|nr:GNAT family N-acetyltransferase [Gemmatimonadales bacterium]